MSVSPTTISMLQVSPIIYQTFSKIQKTEQRTSISPCAGEKYSFTAHQCGHPISGKQIHVKFSKLSFHHLNTPLLEKCEANTDHPSCNSLHMIFPGVTSFTSDTSETRSLEHRLGSKVDSVSHFICVKHIIV